MRISYDKLFKLLRRKGMKPCQLRRAAEIAPNTFTRLRKDEPVTLDILMRMAQVLDCDIGDMCGFVKDDEEENI